MLRCLAYTKMRGSRPPRLAFRAIIVALSAGRALPQSASAWVPLGGALGGCGGARGAGEIDGADAGSTLTSFKL